MTTYRNAVYDREELLVNGEKKCSMVQRQHEKTTEIVICDGTASENNAPTKTSISISKQRPPTLWDIIGLILMILVIGLIAGMQHSSPEIWTYLQSLLEKLLPLL